MLLFFCFRRPLTRLGDEDSSSSSGVWLNELLWLALLAELTMASEVTSVTEEHGGGGGGGAAPAGEPTTAILGGTGGGGCGGGDRSSASPVD